MTQAPPASCGGADVPWGEHGPLARPGTATSVLGPPRPRSPSEAEAQAGPGVGVPRGAVGTARHASTGASSHERAASKSHRDRLAHLWTCATHRGRRPLTPRHPGPHTWLVLCRPRRTADRLTRNAVPSSMIVGSWERQMSTARSQACLGREQRTPIGHH